MSFGQRENYWHIPFPVSQRLQHANHIVLFFYRELATWYIQGQLLSMSECISKVVRLFQTIRPEVRE